MIVFTALVLAILANAPATGLEGTTVDRDGKPVDGAEVWLVGRANPEGMPIVAHGRSDEHGRFALARRGARARGRRRLSARDALGRADGDARGRPPVPGPAPRSRATDPARAGSARGKPRSTSWIPTTHPWSGRRSGSTGSLKTILASPIRSPTGSRRPPTRPGRAVLDGFASAELVAIAVRAKGFGSQPRTFHPPTRGPKTVRLSPVAKVSGRLAGGEPAILRGWKVSAWTMSSDGPTGRPGSWIGGAEATSDDEGRFEIPAIAAGNLTITCRPPEGIPYLAENLSAGLRAGQDNPITVVVRHAVRLEGQFRDRQSGAPVPGVQLGAIFRRNGRVDTTITDDQGRFSQLVLPGDVSISTSKVPRPYVNTPATGWRTVNVPKGVNRFAVEPIELIRAATPIAVSPSTNPGSRPPAPRSAARGR